MNNEYAIIIQNLTKKFGNFIAVDNISLEIIKGEIFGFLGANGAGKSTTIRMLCGLLSPSAGSAKVAGFDISKETELVKASIGYMSQKFSLYSDLTIDENILFYGGIYGLTHERIEKRRNEVLDLMNLSSVRKVLCRELSRGYLQRLSFACAILHEPQIIFLDEPTSGVDPIQRRNFWNLMYDLAEKGITIFVTTHFLDEAEFCNRLSLIVNGKIVAIGSVAGFKSLLDHYPIYEIECEESVKALEVMQNAEWVKQVSIFGKSIHVTLKKMDSRLRGNDGIGDASDYITENRFTSILAKNNIKVQQISRIKPSLEDVFLYLVEGKN